MRHTIHMLVLAPVIAMTLAASHIASALTPENVVDRPGSDHRRIAALGANAAGQGDAMSQTGPLSEPLVSQERVLRNHYGLCLDVHAPDMQQNGARVQVWQCNGEPQQLWRYHANGTIRNSTGKCLDVHAPDMRSNGGRVQVWDCNGSLQQSWRLDDMWLVNGGGKCLDVHVPERQLNGGRVQVWDCNHMPQQAWEFGRWN